MSAKPVLHFGSVTKIFGTTRVVDDVSFDVESGQVVALLGENGAGKSTLIKMLGGVYRRDGGEILLDGVDVDTPGTREAIAFIHQDLGLVEWMTVAENMALGLGFPRRNGIIDWKSAGRRARQALAVVGGGIDPQTRVFDLTRAEKSLLAIARALAVDCKVLVLDEPTASLPEADVERVFDVMRRLQARGVAMIFVSHRLDEVFRVADEVVVLRDGRLVADGAVSTFSPDSLVEAIVGHQPAIVRSHGRDADASASLRLIDLRVDEVGPVSMDVAAGEMVALVGLRGAGHDVVGRALCGLERITSGQMTLDDEVCSYGSPRAAIKGGVAFVTSNREAESMAVGMCVRENLFINPGIRNRRWNQLERRSSEQRRAIPLIAQFKVRPPDPERDIGVLSGGNQQKVILARWFGVGARVIVLEEPTMGVDVGARADIYSLLHEEQANGTAVVVVSTDFQEVAQICDRALVFDRGVVVAEFSGDELTVASLISAASAGDAIGATA